MDAVPFDVVKEIEGAIAAADRASEHLKRNPHFGKADAIFWMLTPNGDPYIIRSDTRYHASDLSVNGAGLQSVRHHNDRHANSWEFALQAPLPDGRALAIDRTVMPYKEALLQRLTIRNPTPDTRHPSGQPQFRLQRTQNRHL